MKYKELGRYDKEYADRTGFLEGKEVWFIDTDGFDDEWIKKGKIIGYNEGFDRELLLEIEYEEEKSVRWSDDIWVVNENERARSYIRNESTKVVPDIVSFDRDTVIKRGERIFENNVAFAESKLKHEINKLKKFKEKYKNGEQEENIPSTQ